MKKFNSTIRIITGIFFILLSGNKIGILPTALDIDGMFTERGLKFVASIQETGYMFETIAFFAFFCGLAFLFNRYVALASVVMIPISLNFVLFHIFLGFPVTSIFSFEFARGSIAFIFFFFNAYVLFTQRNKFRDILKN